MKAAVKCGRVSFSKIKLNDGREVEVAYLDRLSHHPKLGPPRTESQTRTSVVLAKYPEARRFETLNTIYEIIDESYISLQK